MDATILLLCIIILLGFIILMLWNHKNPVIISDYPETVGIQDIQAWNPITHPYANDFRHRPLHFGYHRPMHGGGHGRFR